VVTSELDSLGLLYRQPAALWDCLRKEKGDQEESRTCSARTHENSTVRLFCMGPGYFSETSNCRQHTVSHLVMVHNFRTTAALL